MKGAGPIADMIQKQHRLFCKKWGLNKDRFQFNKTLFKVPTAQQSLF
jgi:hypothetical protein